MNGLVAERGRGRERERVWFGCTVWVSAKVSCAENKRMSGLASWPQWLIGVAGLHPDSVGLMDCWCIFFNHCAMTWLSDMLGCCCSKQHLLKMH